MCPRQDSNLRAWLRRPPLYPLSYGGSGLGRLAARAGSQFSVLASPRALAQRESRRKPARGTGHQRCAECAKGGTDAGAESAEEERHEETDHQADDSKNHGRGNGESQAASRRLGYLTVRLARDGRARLLIR